MKLVLRLYLLVLALWAVQRVESYAETPDSLFVEQLRADVHASFDTDSAVRCAERLRVYAHKFGLVDLEAFSCDALFWSYFRQDRILDAYNCANYAMNLADSVGDVHMQARSFHGVGLAFGRMGHSSLANKNLYAAVALYAQCGDSLGQCVALRDVGQDNYVNFVFDSAEVNIQRAIRIDALRADSSGLAEDYAHVGAMNLQRFVADPINRNWQALSLARVCFEKALRIARTHSNDKAITVVYTGLPSALYWLASNEVVSERRTALLDSCASELSVARGVVSGDDVWSLDMLAVRLALARRNVSEAERMALALHDRVMSTDGQYALKEGVMTLMAEVAEAQGDVRRAYECMKLSDDYHRASISKSKATELMMMMARGQFEGEKMKAKGREMELKAKARVQKLMMVVALVMLLLVATIAIILTRNYRRSRRMNKIISRQNREITESLNYARVIQNAVMPSSDDMSDIFGDNMVVYQPLRIVSGDFYWAQTVGKYKILVVGDCTGHGVPGGFLSMLGMSILEYTASALAAANASGHISAGEMLDDMRKTFKRTLNQHGFDREESHDAIDLALVIFDVENHELRYAGAFRPLIIFRNGEMLTTRADRMPIGVYYKEREHFTEHVLPIEENDVIYLYSDGLTDQLGYGSKEDVETYSVRRFFQLLRQIHTLPFSVQKAHIATEMSNWRTPKKEIGLPYEQTDDVVLVGISVRNMLERSEAVSLGRTS